MSQRGQGNVYRPSSRGKPIAVWWLRYSIRGKQHRESSGTTNKTEALRLLRQRIGDREAGKIIGNPAKVTLGELRALVEKQYDLDGLRSKERVVYCWKHLERFFGADTRAMEITGTRLDDYAAARLKERAARQTVNNELAALRRGFKLGVAKGLLGAMPTFDLPKVQNARSGFFEEDDFAALIAELPRDVGDLVQFLRATGWRRDEGRLLTWAAVDLEAGTIRLEGARSKSGKPRVFPFGLAPSLKALLGARWKVRDGLYVFHRDGQPFGKSAIATAWKHATKKAGLDGRLVHDLRRTAARDFRRAGVSEGEIMALCGWETRSMFDRYNIISEADLGAAVAKRFNATSTEQANNAAPAGPAD